MKFAPSLCLAGVASLAAIGFYLRTGPTQELPVVQPLAGAPVLEDSPAGTPANSLRAHPARASDEPADATPLRAPRTARRPVTTESDDPISQPAAGASAPVAPAARDPQRAAVRAASAIPAAVSTLSALPAGAEFIVPFGAKLPATLVDAGEGATPAQIEVLDRIGDQFLQQLPAADEVAVTPPTPRARDRAAQPGSDWQEAARLADERYRQIFGVEAYKAWTAAAAREALEEKRAGIRR